MNILIPVLILCATLIVVGCWIEFSLRKRLQNINYRIGQGLLDISNKLTKLIDGDTRNKE